MIWDECGGYKGCSYIVARKCGGYFASVFMSIHPYSVSNLRKNTDDAISACVSLLPCPLIYCNIVLHLP